MRLGRGGFLCMVLLTTACSGRAVPAGPEPVAPDQAQAIATQQQDQTCVEGQEPWRSPGPPKRGGVLVVSVNPLDHLDVTAPGRTGAIYQVYNGMMQNRNCFTQDFTPTPVLARSWEVSGDGLTWTFKLRDDVKWQNKPPVNGRPFTSADVAWTIGLQKAGGLARDYWKNVDYETPDAGPVILRTKERDADFLEKIADYRNSVVPHEVKEQYGDFKTVAIGTSGLVLQDYKVGGDATLVPNPAYWVKGLDGKPLPYVDQGRQGVFADIAAEMAAFRAGQVDQLSASVGAPEVDQLKQSTTKFQETVAYFNAVHSLYFNFKRNTPFRDERVRRAVSLAIDRDALIAAYRGGVYAGFLPAYLRNWSLSQETLRQKAPTDLDQAKKLLTEAGYPPGTRVYQGKLVTATRYAPGAEVVQQQLAAIGISVSVDVDPGANFQGLLQKADFELGWGAYPGAGFPGFWLGDFLRSDSAANYLGINDPRIDSQATALSKELDPAKRRQIIADMESYLQTTWPYVPSFAHLSHTVSSCRLKNVLPFNGTSTTPIGLAAWLDPTGC